MPWITMALPTLTKIKGNIKTFTKLKDQNLRNNYKKSTEFTETKKLRVCKEKYQSFFKDNKTNS